MGRNPKHSSNKNKTTVVFTARRNLLFERYKKILPPCQNHKEENLFFEDVLIFIDELININISADGHPIIGTIVRIKGWQ